MKHKDKHRNIESPNAKFREGTRWKTRALFVETATKPLETALFWLEEPSSYIQDQIEAKGLTKLVGTLPVLKELFMEVGDPSGRLLAINHLGGVPHWKSLMRASWFVEDYLKRWQEELVIKVKAQALEGIIDIALNKTHKSSLVAQKYLVSNDWLKEFLPKEDGKTKAGRPSKEKIAKEAEALAEEKVIRLFEDAERLSKLDRA